MKGIYVDICVLAYVDKIFLKETQEIDKIDCFQGEDLGRRETLYIPWYLLNFESYKYITC